MKNKKDKAQKAKAVALKYNPQEDSAPKITAKGDGFLAEKIIELAKQSGVPIREEKDLVEILSKLDLYEEIPPETYVIVAEILTWVYELNKKAKHSP